jgi:N-methylhydantoinase A
LFVSASSEILPEFREYERMSTTVINAYVSPILDRYLSSLQINLHDSNLQIMQSNGGMISLSQAKSNGARCILSGPAGGIVGAQAIGRATSNAQNPYTEPVVRLITFDMGGTSTDVSLINGQPGFTTETVIGAFPIHLPVLDIHTIGAGGGSLAYIDPGGALRVGPQSAGASPGPACYGIGVLPTVTDANLVLNRLLPDYFLGGEMKIDPGRAFSAVEKLGKELNLSPIQAARGVIEVVNAQMERALRVISIERGYDPHDFSLFSFGGAGGLHAVALARQLHIPRVIISKFASTLSAFGMLASDVVKDYVQTVMQPGNTSFDMLETLFEPMEAKGRDDLVAEGFPIDKIEIYKTIDARYAGQSYELNIQFSDHFLDDFKQLHQATYGYSYEGKPVELVNLRVKALNKVAPIVLPSIATNQNQKAAEPIKFLPVELEERTTELPVYQYSDLLPNSKMTGPMLIVSADTTILVSKQDIVNIDRYHSLLIDVVP